MPTTSRAPERTADPPVVEARDGYVAVLTLNRPDRLNAWTDDMGERYAQLLAAADSDPDVRAIVVTGAGRGFCAGQDMAALAGPRERSPQEREHARRNRAAALEVRKPLIAAINGPAAGLGLAQALFCDIRFAATDAKLTTSFARLGLPAEEGLSWLMPRLIGFSRALDLLLSARLILGSEAEAIGLVDRALPRADVVAAAVDYAQTLARNCSPTAMATIKSQIRADASSTFDDARDRAFSLMLAAFEQPDQREGAMAFAERRPPRFAPLGAR
jgi:enoyl-CoA hydratase/carnithine racemase